MLGLVSVSVVMDMDTLYTTGFVWTLESLYLLTARRFSCLIRFPGLESSGKRHRSLKTLEKSWNSKVVVLEI